MRGALIVLAVLFAREAHVSSGYEDCFADVEVVLCVGSEGRKRFRDDEQERNWMAQRRQEAEARVRAVLPAWRAALHDARVAGVPLERVDDWRVPVDGTRRLRLDFGVVDGVVVSTIVSATRALTPAEATSLRERLQPILHATASSDSDDELASWQPLWIADSASASHVVVGMGTTNRVSPAAQRLWRPWLATQVAVLRAAWSSTACTLPGSSAPSKPSRSKSSYRHVEGLRPWGPLLLDRSVQARVDDGELARMAHTQFATAAAAEAAYGPLTSCLQRAAAPLPAPPH